MKQHRNTETAATPSNLRLDIIFKYLNKQVSIPFLSLMYSGSISTTPSELEKKYKVVVSHQTLHGTKVCHNHINEFPHISTK